MCNVDGLKNAYRIIRVNVAYELSIHQQFAVGTCPVLKSYVHGARAEVAAADTYLHNCSEFLAVSVADLACVYFCGKFCYLCLLTCIESSFVCAVCDNIIAKLAAGKVVKHQSLFTRIDHGSVIKLFELALKIRFFCKICKHSQNFLVDLL